MATANPYKYGFRWKRRLDGGPGAAIYLPERVAAAYSVSPGGTATGLRVGDPVKRVSDGTIALCAATDPTYGIIAGFGVTDFAGAAVGSAYSNKYVNGTAGTPGTETETIVYVIPAAGHVFACVVDDAVSITTLANYVAAFGANLDITINASATTGANPQLDISTVNTTAALVWRIIDYSRDLSNVDPAGVYWELLVTCNVVQQAPYQTTGV